MNKNPFYICIAFTVFTSLVLLIRITIIEISMKKLEKLLEEFLKKRY